jgi:hypothetical protein
MTVWNERSSAKEVENLVLEMKNQRIYLLSELFINHTNSCSDYKGGVYCLQVVAFVR